MATKGVEGCVKEWYWKLPDGSKQGPAEIRDVREKVLSGEITAQTEVSSNGKSWQPAVFSSDFGFDCIVLEVGEALNVLGPFAREYIDQQDSESEIPSDGILYLRGGMVSEAMPSGVVGETGAALVEKVMLAEQRLRESLKDKRAAEIALAAKDLEFDAERQRLNSDLSSKKAEMMKVESELEGVRADVALSDVDKGRRASLEAKLVDTENALAQASNEVRQLKEKNAATDQKANDVKKALSAAETIKNETQTKLKKLEDRLAETGKLLTERQARCVELEGKLARKDESAAEQERRVVELEARVIELDGKLIAAAEGEKALRESATWLRDSVTALAKQAEATFSGVSTDVEEIEAEIVDEPSSEHAVKVRAGQARSEEPRNAKLSAIENQLKREMSTLGASKAASATSGHEGFIKVFKRRK